MGEMKPTPGPWEADGGVVSSNAVSCIADCTFATVMPGWSGSDYATGAHRRDNTRLIAEAGTVFHNTGLSPVQLVEMVKELKVALQDAEEYISGHTPTNSWGLLDRREDADRCETLEKVRAALAKCEGVGNG